MQNQTRRQLIVLRQSAPHTVVRTSLNGTSPWEIADNEQMRRAWQVGQTLESVR